MNFTQSCATFSPCKRYRYRLSREWNSDLPLCAWWMLNPSRANAVDNDLTIIKICGFAKRWGFGGVVAVNMFGLVSTDPKLLRVTSDPIGPKNATNLSRILQDYPRMTRIVCAWGNLPWSFGVYSLWRHVDEWARKLKNDPRTVCLGRTKLGEPRHPSRIGYMTPTESFGVRNGPNLNGPHVIGAGGVLGF